MPVQSVPVGPSVTLNQNVAYALPGRACLLTSSIALETSLDGTTWVPYVADKLTGGVFVRSTVGNALVTCKLT